MYGIVSEIREKCGKDLYGCSANVRIHSSVDIKIAALKASLCLDFKHETGYGYSPEIMTGFGTFLKVNLCCEDNKYIWRCRISAFEWL